MMATIGQRRRPNPGVRTAPCSPPSTRRGRLSRGFTILEVLVSLAIFAMAAVVLASAYLNILNGYQIAARSIDTDPDVTFARSIILTEPDRTKLEQGGQFDTAEGHHVTWSVDIASTNEADLFTVTFTCEVSDPSQRGSQKTVQTFTVLRPTWSVDTSERDQLRSDAKQRILKAQGKATT